MDAPEDDVDVKLQKVSGDLITAFDQRLGPLLRKADGAGAYRVRSRVRSRETAHLISDLLGPFQELPQLLDPHLPKWLPLLAEAFLESLQTRSRSKVLSTRSRLLMPLPTAICKIIYTFCKIRGEKVIVRFLNVETKYLELLLSALEDSERAQDAVSLFVKWTWEERYLVLLWLSHLMFAPFDLSSISSVYMEDVDLAGIPGFFWPSNVPSITIRVLPLAVKYLASPGKERDAAKALLVRMAMRKDMQQLGVVHALVQWSLFHLRPRKDELVQSPYHYLGVLSFLAGILASSADTSDMDKYLSAVFYTVHAISSNNDPMSNTIKSSTLATKSMIKIMRSIAALKLRKNTLDLLDSPSVELVETTIGNLLDSLADNDTPVRFAASKSLSIITLKLDAYYAAQVVEAVLGSLNRNVLWAKNSSNPTTPATRDLTSVDPLEWHGLMLTLSHLLYRRSPPTESLAPIIHALLLGLSFERRSPTGVSTGTNVRDAACFGIWALARRYATVELLAVPVPPVQPSSRPAMPSSVLQILATELVVAAALDPAGNIRRGSSAALQELIGRHPDTVEKGIAVVQTVDYHAVALRSRAIHHVAENATKLHTPYGEAILEALLGWRGIGDPDAVARRVSGLSYGTIAAELSSLSPASGVETLLKSVENILGRIKALQTRQVEERHGMLLALAAVLDRLPQLVNNVGAGGEQSQSSTWLQTLVRQTLDGLISILQFSSTTVFRKPELIAEATGRLVMSSFPVLQAAVLGIRTTDAACESQLLPGSFLIDNADLQTFKEVVGKLQSCKMDECHEVSTFVSLLQRNVDIWLNRAEPEAATAASLASILLLVFSDPKQREKIVSQWAGLVRSCPTSRASSGIGYFFALAKCYPIVAMSGNRSEGDKNTICEALLSRWSGDKDVDVRVAILQSLTQSDVLRSNVDKFLPLISEGLDDYTTNARGDVGSHVRLQAIRATKHLWTCLGQSPHERHEFDKAVQRLLLLILRLAAEKLDRVRVEAQSTLSLALSSTRASQFMKSTFSSQGYFRFLLDLLTIDWLHEAIPPTVKNSPNAWMDELMAGYVISADTGNEDLVIASRAALADYCEASPDNLDRVCAALHRNMRSRQGQDRILVPTLEIIAFLFSVVIFQRCTVVDYKNLCLQVQRAGYRTGNVRKLEACIKVYGGIAAMQQQEEDGGGLAQLASQALEQRRREGIAEARRRLGAFMSHPWPRVRTAVVDELWGLLSTRGGGEHAEKLKSVDWGRADKGAVKGLIHNLALM